MKKYDQYKNSGVEWLGEIPEHWEVKPLKSVAKIKSIINYSDLDLLSVYLDKGVIKFNEIEAKRTNVTSLDLSKYQLVEKGDFVLNNQQAWRGSVGVSNFKGIISPAYIILSLSDLFDVSFANYYFRNYSILSQYVISSKGVGTIQRNLYWPQLKGTYIAIAPLQEQSAIANFLDDKTAKIDQAIAIKQKQIELLKERRQILIHKAVTRGLNENVKLKDSGVEWIGEIPEHWEVKALKNVIKAIGDVDHYMPPTIESGIPYVMTGDLKEFASKIDFDGCKKVSNRDFFNLTKKIKSTKGDVILARYATIGTSTYIDVDIDFLVSYSCVTIKTDSIKLLGFYLFFYFKSEAFAIDIKNQINTNTQGNVGIGDLRKVKIVLPPIIEQKQIVEFIEISSTKIATAISLKEREIEKMKEYKMSLIDGVVTGKVRVF